jgi:hypothetical protein
VTAIVWSLATVVAGLLPPTPTPVPGIAQVGREAPAISVTALDGRTIRREFPGGRPLFALVFSTVGAPSRAQIRSAVDAYRTFHSRIDFLGIDEGELPSVVTSFARHAHVPFALAIDQGHTSGAFGADRVPFVILIDAHGIVRMLRRGPVGAADIARELARVAGN